MVCAPDVVEKVRQITTVLQQYTYRFSNEIVLHEGMAAVLGDSGIEFEREVVAGPSDRFDFLVPPGIVIEAKVKGSFSKAAHQIARYAERHDVSAVVLVATRHWAGDGSLPREMNGKPLRIVKLRRAAF
jgi:hypothetical protein